VISRQPTWSVAAASTYSIVVLPVTDTAPCSTQSSRRIGRLACPGAVDADERVTVSGTRAPPTDSRKDASVAAHCVAAHGASSRGSRRPSRSASIAGLR
jgi:hypothetical protein